MLVIFITGTVPYEIEPTEASSVHIPLSPLKPSKVIQHFLNNNLLPKSHEHVYQNILSHFGLIATLIPSLTKFLTDSNTWSNQIQKSALAERLELDISKKMAPLGNRLNSECALYLIYCSFLERPADSQRFSEQIKILRRAGALQGKDISKQTNGLTTSTFYPDLVPIVAHHVYRANSSYLTDAFNNLSNWD